MFLKRPPIPIWGIGPSFAFLLGGVDMTAFFIWLLFYSFFELCLEIKWLRLPYVSCFGFCSREDIKIMEPMQ
jgi:hypothetical protein